MSIGLLRTFGACIAPKSLRICERCGLESFLTFLTVARGVSKASRFTRGKSGVARLTKRVKRDALLSAPESAHQQWGGSPHRTEHWLSVAEGNCVAERRGGEQPEANDQSIIKKMMNSIRPDALASLLGKGEAQNGGRPGKGLRQLRDLTCGESSERRDRSAWGGWR